MQKKFFPSSLSFSPVQLYQLPAKWNDIVTISLSPSFHYWREIVTIITAINIIRIVYPQSHPSIQASLQSRKMLRFQEGIFITKKFEMARNVLIKCIPVVVIISISILAH